MSRKRPYKFTDEILACVAKYGPATACELQGFLFLDYGIELHARAIASKLIQLDCDREPRRRQHIFPRARPKWIVQWEYYIRKGRV